MTLTIDTNCDRNFSKINLNRISGDIKNNNLKELSKKNAMIKGSVSQNVHLRTVVCTEILINDRHF